MSSGFVTFFDAILRPQNPPVGPMPTVSLRRAMLESILAVLIFPPPKYRERGLPAFALDMIRNERPAFKAGYNRTLSALDTRVMLLPRLTQLYFYHVPIRILHRQKILKQSPVVKAGPTCSSTSTRCRTRSPRATRRASSR